MEISDLGFYLSRVLQDSITMSFPPRPPLGLQTLPPLPPGLMPPGYALASMGMSPVLPLGVLAAPLMSGLTHLPPVTDSRVIAAATTVRRPVTNNYKKSGPGYSTFRNQKNNEEHKQRGPSVTVFVGNITERAPDVLIKQMLQRCGPVTNWKRVQGASGKLQAFGFCEYADPESALRAMRILMDWELADKKLLLKVDANAKAQLDAYKASKGGKPQESSASGDGDNKDKKPAVEEVDEQTRLLDNSVRDGLETLIKDYEIELLKPIVTNDKKKSAKGHESKSSENEEELIKDPKESIDDMDLEEDKKKIISREIDKFRDCMKKLEEQKEKDRKEKEKRDDGDRDRDRQRDNYRDNYNNRRQKYSSPERFRRNSRERSYGRSRSRSRERNREPEWDNRQKSPSIRDRSREIEKKREDDLAKEREEEEEAYERRRLEKKLREKEAAYQERLRQWETRERKKSREYEKEKEKEERRKMDENREAKRLKEFLEDYDDDRDDPKFYKGTALAQRLREREKEEENDKRDRQREKEELEELRKKLLEDGHPDPNGEVERFQREQEEQYKPKMQLESLIELRNSSPVNRERDRERERERRKLVPLEDEATQNSLSESSGMVTPIDEVKVKPMGFAGLRLGGVSPHHHSQTGSDSNQTSTVNGKRKKLSVGDVFNQDDDDDSNDMKNKKKKLTPLNDDLKIDGSTPNQLQMASQEEKRKHIKSLIDKIPTEKEKLFQYSIDWSLVDGQLMDRRIKPWINKKIVEYIGEEEPSLVEFICSKVMLHSAPLSILDDVQMVLDEEAEVFIVKMWRLLIYEIEAKKLGLASATQKTAKT